jgi:Calcineurin-like phosphoesterase
VTDSRPIWWSATGVEAPDAWIAAFRALTDEERANEMGLTAAIFIARVRRRTGRGPTFSELFSELFPRDQLHPEWPVGLTYPVRATIHHAFRLHVAIQWKRGGMDQLGSRYRTKSSGRSDVPRALARTTGSEGAMKAFEYASDITLPDQRVAVCGDWHGNVGWVRTLSRILPALAPDVTTILQLGDWWIDPDVVDETLADTDIDRIYVTLGNHEPWDQVTPIVDASAGSAVRVSELTWLLARPARRSSPVEWCNRFVILQGCGG